MLVEHCILRGGDQYQVYAYTAYQQNAQGLASLMDFWRAARRLCMINGSPGGTLSLYCPFLDAWK